jgi:hypothetical protein
MWRKHWREPDFWRWYWQTRVRFEAKALLSLVLLAAILGGGWVAADRLSSAGAATSQTQTFSYETTIQKVVTVREKGKLVRKVVPVVQRLFLTTTALRTNVVTVAGGVETVKNQVVVSVPVVSTKVISTNGKSRTVVTTRLVPTTTVLTQTFTQTQVKTQVETDVQTRTQLQTQTQTNIQTETQTNTQTQTSTVTTTRTVTQPVTSTRTVTRTVVATTTATVPTTVTATVTATVPVTVTVPTTITVTAPTVP